ncbi:hypothetical protein VEE56_40300 [Escherichia coli]|nr:hypothetical protein VEE56_40300 [Escherichia coli]
MTSLKTSIKTITYLSDIGCLEIQGASLASVQGMGITILRGEENISINSDILVTLQKFFEEDCATHTGMSQTEDNLHAVAMKITADIMQDAD